MKSSRVVMPALAAILLAPLAALHAAERNVSSGSEG